MPFVKTRFFPFDRSTSGLRFLAALSSALRSPRTAHSAITKPVFYESNYLRLFHRTVLQSFVTRVSRTVRSRPLLQPKRSIGPMCVHSYAHAYAHTHAMRVAFPPLPHKVEFRFSFVSTGPLFRSPVENRTFNDVTLVVKKHTRVTPSLVIIVVLLSCIHIHTYIYINFLNIRYFIYCNIRSRAGPGGKDPWLLIDFSEETARPRKPLIFYLITHGLRACRAIDQIVYHEHGTLHGH